MLTSCAYPSFSSGLHFSSILSFLFFAASFLSCPYHFLGTFTFIVGCIHHLTFIFVEAFKRGQKTKQQEERRKKMGASSRRYTSVPQSGEAALSPPLGRSARDFTASVGDDDEEGGGFPVSRGSQRNSYWTIVKRGLFLAVLATGALALGFCAGSKHQQMKGCSSSSNSNSGHDHEQQQQHAGGLLPPQSLVPDSTYFALSFLGEEGGRGFPRTVIFHINSILTSLPPQKKYPPRTSNSASPRPTKTRVSRATNYGMPSCRVRPNISPLFPPPPHGQVPFA